MKIQASFVNRALAQYTAPPAVTFRVEQYSMHVLGGPSLARIVATGRDEDLWDCINLLRCGVELHDERGDVVWWGYVDEVRVNMDSAEWGVSLGEMANAIAVAYSTQEGAIASAGTRNTTAWAQDALSVAEYGQRQLILTANNTTAAAAAAARDQALSAIGWPLPIADLSEGNGSKVVLLCRGWWDTLGWVYYNNPSGIYGLGTTPDERWNLGTNGDAWLNFIWRLDAGTQPFDTLSLYLFTSPWGVAADDVLIELRTNDVSGTLLASITVPAATIAAAQAKNGLIDIPIGTTITGSTSYICVLLKKTGELTEFNFYQLGVARNAPFANSIFQRKPGTAGWETITSIDVVFKLTVKTNIITQITGMMQTAGQFLTAIDVETSSTIATNPFRGGDATARAQIEELMTMHTGGAGRLAAEITIDRRARIYGEPDASQLMYVDRYITPFNAGGAPLERHYCPYGLWASLKEVMPTSGIGSGGDAASGAVGFIESADYNVAQDRWVPHFRKNKRAFTGGQ